MNILFINPNLSQTPMLNLGLAYIISAVKSQHKIKLVDCVRCRKKLESFLDENIGEFIPNIIAFSTTSFTYKKALDILTHLRPKFPRAHVVFGGIHPTLFPDETIAQQGIDAICIGEGELSFPEYLNYLEHPHGDVPKGIWQKLSTGEIVKTSLRKLHDQIDDFLFPDWSDWDTSFYIKNATTYLPNAMILSASRGCPYKCTFCSNHALSSANTGTWFRQRSAASVIAEIHALYRQYQGQFESLFFYDETFGADIRQARSLCNAIANDAIAQKIPWMCQTRPDVITAEFAELLQKSNCRLVMLGFDSGNDHVRKNILGRNISNEKILNATKLLKEKNIGICGTFLYGLPEETSQIRLESIQLAKKISPLAAYWLRFHPLPQTTISEKYNLYLNESNSNHWLRGPGSWQLPQISLLEVLRIKIFHIHTILKSGWQAKRLSFFKDVCIFLLNEIFSPNRIYRKHFRFFYLQQQTIMKYLLE